MAGARDRAGQVGLRMVVVTEKGHACAFFTDGRWAVDGWFLPDGPDAHRALVGLANRLGER